MTKEIFGKVYLSKANRKQLDLINEILEEYALQGYKLTLRQVYYQLVSKDIIPNQKKEYAKLSGLLVKGRMAGIIDWNAIEDRIRVPFLPYWIHGIDDAIDDTIESYRLNRQKDQDVYIELWVEKDALSGVLKRITSHYHINLMVNRGYSSCTAIHDAYKRVIEKLASGKKVVLLYLGDHDPSGLDMDRDIKNRLKEFIINSDTLQNIWHEKANDSYGKNINRNEFTHLASDVEEWFEDERLEGKEREKFYDMEETDNPILMMDKIYASKIFSENLEVRRIGLTQKQIKKYNPPPNPAKITDPRAKWYISEFGKISWELDSLNPKVLHQLVKDNVEELIDMDLFNKKIRQEEMDKKKLKKATLNIN